VIVHTPQTGTCGFNGGTMADGIVSLTIALLPPALVGTQVGDLPIYLINLLPG
jgi:hypothetical protein